MDPTEIRIEGVHTELNWFRHHLVYGIYKQSNEPFSYKEVSNISANRRIRNLTVVNLMDPKRDYITMTKTKRRNMK
jgi:hypothetical protein